MICVLLFTDVGDLFLVFVQLRCALTIVFLCGVFFSYAVVVFLFSFLSHILGEPDRFHHGIHRGREVGQAIRLGCHDLAPQWRD